MWAGQIKFPGPVWQCPECNVVYIFCGDIRFYFREKGCRKWPCSYIRMSKVAMLIYMSKVARIRYNKLQHDRIVAHPRTSLHQILFLLSHLHSLFPWTGPTMKRLPLRNPSTTSNSGHFFLSMGVHCRVYLDMTTTTILSRSITWHVTWRCVGLLVFSVIYGGEIVEKLRLCEPAEP